MKIYFLHIATPFIPTPFWRTIFNMIRHEHIIQNLTKKIFSKLGYTWLKLIKKFIMSELFNYFMHSYKICLKYIMRGWEIKMILIKKFHLFLNALWQKEKKFSHEIAPTPYIYLSFIPITLCIERKKLFFVNTELISFLMWIETFSIIINKKI